MNRGYIKLWRKALDAGWIKNHKLWAFWTWCLFKASHKEMDLIVGTQTVHLMSGEFVFGRKAASMDTNISEQSIRTLIDSLRKSKNLTIKSTNKFSIVSIVNWDIYQGNGNEINQQSNQQVTSNQQTTNHKQELKNEEECKETSLSVGDKSPTCPYQEILDLYHRILPELPQMKTWTAKRKDWLKSRWREDEERQTLSWWEQYFLKVRSSPFLMGNVKSFKANLEWIINKSNMIKIIEGNYDGGNNDRSTFGRAEQHIKKSKRAARSDGKPYPVDFDG